MDSYIWKTCLEALEIEMFMAVLCLVVVSLALLRVVGYWVGTCLSRRWPLLVACHLTL